MPHNVQYNHSVAMKDNNYQPCQGQNKPIDPHPGLVSLVPRPPPRFYLTAVEKNREIKFGRRPGNEARFSSVKCGSIILQVHVGNI